MPSRIRTPTPPSLLRLPPELLSEIFLWYKHLIDPSSTFSDGAHDFYTSASDPILSLPEPNSATSYALLLLGSISRSLRNIAWTTPQLWTHIALGLSHDHSRLKAQISGLTSWLARSGGCSLHIHLQCSYSPQDIGFPSEETIDRRWALDPPFVAMDAITAHLAHWEEVCLVLPYKCYTRFLQKQNARMMPMLKRLILLYEKNWFMPTHSERVLELDTFAVAPALTEVSLLNFPSRSLMPVLPWGQVTRFRGHHLDLADFLDVLQCLPLLETCTVSWAIGYPPVCDPIVHANLHTLKVEGSVSVLKYLTLPALESLRIKTRRAFTGQQCVQLLLRSGCKLTSLHICVNFISTATLIECLEAAPTLRELKVLNRNDRIHSVFSNFLIERLTLRGGKLDLAPQLRRLEVLSCSCQFDVEVLVEMLSSRGGSTFPGDGWAKGRGKGDWGRLESFWLETISGCASKVWEDVMYSPRIRGLMEQGMAIRVVV